jgi:ribosomal protein S18 acetylase RimI-like enzyme
MHADHPPGMRIVPASEAEPDALRAHLVKTWHDEAVAAHGELMRPQDHPGFVALDREGRIAGHAAYRIEADGSCYVVSIDAEPPGAGIGSALAAAVESAAREAGCQRVWLDTTNDNLGGLRFYQRRGYRIVAVRPGAVDAARRTLKPSIPVIGSSGIPMRDELELEKFL